MGKSFKIVTTKETASAVEKQCQFEAKHNNRSFKLVSVNHHQNYSEVTLEANNLKEMEPEDIFFLGLFTGLNMKQ